MSYVLILLSGHATPFHPIPPDHSAFLCMPSRERVRATAHLVLFFSVSGDEDIVTMETTGPVQCTASNCKLLCESVEQYGSFVMTRAPSCNKRTKTRTSVTSQMETQ
ncbi:hypothetical protein ACHHYP_05737 [Achlya hypogyna]|uniref:Uncharacterized protein n=1 Tax=Achlya hypogyna TaxID=1202772 RepID=A0A1V9YWS5_ACHHY|nr:hypothetical protein ACHHYP_05737 [Achlya hypogyna]